MKYNLSDDQKRKLEQFARSNFAELFSEIMKERQQQIYVTLRLTLPEAFAKEQGRLLEIDDLLTALNIRERGE